MNLKLLFKLFFPLSLLLLSNSLDYHTLSNYKNITITNLTGIFYPDFTNKILKGNLTYTFQANNEGKNIILDSKFLNIISIYEISPENKKLNYYFDEPDKKLGTPLVIEREFKDAEQIKININFSTINDGSSVQFLEKSQTINKNFPFFFTQSALIIGRELLPSQDTPAVKFPFHLGIKVMNPLRGMISGLYERNETKDNDNTTIFYYYQKIPIPNYLIALAAGDIVEKKLNEQVSVYSEPGFIEKVVKEFEDIPHFLNYSQEYMGEYEWGKYNILVLPYSFPYSGMSNPCLTFCSPSLINDDKSLVDFIVHELIHSWSGNLVTNENWRDFWLNEGITKFLQRKVMAKWKNDDYAKMDYLLGLSYITKNLEVFGLNNTLTSLRPDLTGFTPDEILSNIPHEKGSNFIYYLEGIKGENLTQQFFKNYFQNFKYKSIDVFDFKNYFIKFCRENNVDKDILEYIKWNEWIFEPGDCPFQNNFSNKYNDELNKVMERFLAEDFDGLDEEFKNLITSAKAAFFLRLEERNIFLTDKQHGFLTNTLELYHNQNYLVTTHYLRLILKETNEFLPHEFESLKEYLTSYGVRDFMDGIYSLFYKRDEISAVDILNNCSNFYHRIMMNMAQKEIRELKNSFPIISFDFKDQCAYKFYIYSNEYNEHINSFGTIDIKNGVYLISSDNKAIELKCHLDSEESYCLPIKNIEFEREYLIYIPKRIQEKNFAVKKFNGTIKYKIYLNEKNILESNNTYDPIKIDYGDLDYIYHEISFKNIIKNTLSVNNGTNEINCTIPYKEKKLRCRIDNHSFSYDVNKETEYKNTTLTVYECGIELYSIVIMAIHSDESIKLDSWAIILIIIGVIIAFFILLLLLFHKLTKRKKRDVKMKDIKHEKLVE